MKVKLLSLLKRDRINIKQIKKYTNRKITVLNKTDSTNRYLKENAENAEHGEIVVARRQTAGHGRMGRNFISPEGGIYMSIFLHSDSENFESADITALCAVAVAKAIESVICEEVKIKWVNDIFYKGKKVCGILTETVCEGGKVKYIIVGIGIDVYKQKNLPDELKPIVGSLFEKKCGVINKLIARVTEEFFALYGKSYIDEYRKRSLLDGQVIEYTENGRKISAKVLGVDENCGLIVENSQGRKILRSGEVRICGYERE